MDLESLDVKDRRLLLALDMGARKTDSAIANEIGLSKQVTNYRIKRLEKRGILKSYYAVIDHARIGLKQYRIALKLENVDNKKEQEIIDYLKSRSNWLVTVFGPWNITMSRYATDEYDILKFWKEFYDRYGYYVSKKWITLVTRSWKYERSFIFPKKKNRKLSFPVGTEQSPVDIDKIDEEILAELTVDARKSSFEIAKKLKQSERVIRYRIKKLEEKKVILGYRPFLNTVLLGFKFYKVFLELKDASSQERQNIRTSVLQHPNVAYCTEALGGGDLEFEVHFHDSQALFAFTKEIREIAPTMIKDISSIEYVKEHKMTYYVSK